MEQLPSVDQLKPEDIKARRILVIGATDAGKTTLIKRLYNSWCSKEKVLVLDTDVGQSNIGPPGALGLGTGRHFIGELAQLQEVALHFAGVLSPPEDLAQFLWGIEWLFRLALSIKPDRLLIDTTGWVWGGAISLKMAKCNLINPDLVIAISKEEAPLLEVLKHSTFPLLALRPSPSARARNAEARRHFRLQRVRSYFSKGERGTLELKSFMIIKNPQQGGDLRGRVVGLLDGAFRTLGISWIGDVDQKKGTAEAWTRWVLKGEARCIKVGPMIVSPTG